MASRRSTEIELNVCLYVDSRKLGRFSGVDEIGALLLIILDILDRILMDWIIGRGIYVGDDDRGWESGSWGEMG